MKGIRSGFRIGFKYEELHNLRQPQGNTQSAYQNVEAVNAYLQKKVELGRIVHIENPSLLPQLHYNPIGVIPKKHKPGKWRLIVNLSAPVDHSVNDGITKDLCSLSYVSINEVTTAALALGRGTLMAKMDIKEAYRLVPVHPEDRLLQGMQWQDTFYIDKTLPFGLRSAPLIFTALADGLEWAIRQRGVEYIFHYVDDFIVLEHPGTDECANGMATSISTMEELGAHIEPEKTKDQAHAFHS